ncbi:MAG: hypothetical protein ACJA2D_001510 [Pseudohongiellaceae bacterium]
MRFLVAISKIVVFRLLNVQLYRALIVAIVQQFETVKALFWLIKTFDTTRNSQISSLTGLFCPELTISVARAERYGVTVTF